MNKYSEFDEENEGKTNYMDVFFRYMSHWKWFVVVMIFSLAVAFLYVKFTLPYYKITTTLLLKDDQKGGGTAEMDVFKEMGLFTQKNNVDNELEQLKTTTLVGQVVKELGLYANYMEVGTIPLLNNLGKSLGIPTLGRYDTRVLYGDECPVLVRLPENELANFDRPVKFEILIHPYGEYEFTGVFNDRKYKEKASISDIQVILPFGKVLLTRGKFRPKKDMIMEVILINVMDMAAGYTSMLKMDLTSKTTSVVNIALTAANQHLGKDFLNKMIEVYNREDLNDQTAMATKAAQFIDERLITLTHELGDVESQVENYKQDQGITDIKTQSDMFIQQTGDFTQKKLQIETQLAIVSDIDDYMHKKENKYQLLPANTGITSAGLSELIYNYNKLVMDRTRLARIASESNQAMIDLTSQIESMFNTVQSSVRNERNNLMIADRDLTSKNNENAARIRAIPRQEREYTEIKRQQGVKEALFLFLLQKKEEKYLNLSLVEPIAKIIDNVRSDDVPVSPKKSMIMIFAFFMGILIPVGGIKIRDLLRYQIETKEELEQLSSVPVLGEVLKTDLKDKLIIQENNTDAFTELFRLLRTNLLFVLDSSDKKVINVVSSISGEGKSFVTINLAMSLAMLDKKVLVIGLDVRKPKLASYLGLDNKTGITHYLTGHLTREELIRPSGVHPNLSIITSGPIPPNPNELLAKPALDKLLAELRKEYDYIVIDTAPIGVVSDSFSLNRLADLNLLVVRADYTHKKSVEDATKLFRHKKLKNLYFVLNATDPKKNSYHLGYGKKYGYSYGYGNENKKIK